MFGLPLLRGPPWGRRRKLEESLAAAGRGVTALSRPEGGLREEP